MNYIKLKSLYNDLYSEYNLHTGRDTDYVLCKADYITRMGHII
jgi:hypothetical protein